MSNSVKLHSDDNVTREVPHCSTERPHIALEGDEQYRSFFELNRVIEWILEKGFKRTALQLSDDFLRYSFWISQIIETECKDTKIYILADTNYGSCCVDFVTAEHSDCDSIVHLGEACLSATSNKVPVLYIFGKSVLDIEKFSASISSQLHESSASEFWLLTDAVYAHSSDELNNAVQKILREDQKLQICKIATDSASNVRLGRIIPESDCKAKDLIFVGSKDSQLLPIWLMTFTNFTNILQFDPNTGEFVTDSPSSFRRLKKRLFLIEKLRDANVVGLVVGSLGVRGYQDGIQRVRQLCKNVHKKCYVFSIGKLNEAKLSNFAGDIDAFILLSCPFGIILNTNEYFKPILSLFEAEIALNPSRQWFASEGWTSEFNDFISDEIGAEDLEKTDVSLITGKIRGQRIIESEDAAKSREIVEYTAGDYFANRSWRGLDDANRDVDTELKDGLKGVAMGYSSEKNN